MQDDMNPYQGTNPEFDSAATGPTGTSGKAIASIVLGVASFILCLLTGIPAIIFGALSLTEITKSGGRLSGRGLAIAGIVLGSIGSVISVIGILIALLLPAIQAAREAARRNSSINNIKQIGLAMHNHHDINKAFPPCASLDSDNQPLLSWRVHILPYMEEQALYEQFHLDEPWDSKHNLALVDQMPMSYQRPASEAELGHASYVMVTTPGSLGASAEGLSMRDIRDGTSKTLSVVEVADEFAPVWTKPDDLVDAATLEQRMFLRAGGVRIVGFIDGHVMSLDESLDPGVLEALFTTSGDEPIPMLY